MGLIDDHEVPMDLAKSWEDFGPFRKVERRNHASLFEPLIDTELIPNIVSFDNEKLLIELLLKFALPLKGKIGWADDKEAIHNNLNKLSKKAIIK